MKTFILLALLALPLSAHAKGGGTKEGNGGDAVVCFKTPQMRDYVSEILHKNRDNYNPIPVFEEDAVRADVDSVAAFDHYEYVRPFGYPPQSRDVITPTGDYQETIEAVLTRLEAKSNYARDLREYSKKYPLTNWRAVPGVPEMDDAGEMTFLPRTCVLVQLALRTKGQIYFDSYLFSRLSVLDQVTLSLHEWIYAKARDEGVARDSESIRPLVGLMISKSEFEAISAVDLRVRLAALTLHKNRLRLGPIDYPVNGQPLRVEPDALFPNGAVHTGTVFGEVKLRGEILADCVKGCEAAFHPSAEPTLNPLATLEYDATKIRSIKWRGLTLKLAGGPKNFYPNGIPKSLELAGAQRVRIGRYYYIADGEVPLYPSGSIQSIRSGENYFKVGYDIRQTAYQVDFYSNGQLKQITPVESAKVPTPAGDITCQSHHYSRPAITFHSNGKLASCQAMPVNSKAKHVLIRVGTGLVKVEKDTILFLHDNGSGEKFVPAEPTNFHIGRRIVRILPWGHYTPTNAYAHGGLAAGLVDPKTPLEVEWKGARIKIAGAVAWNDAGRIMSGQLVGRATLDSIIYGPDSLIEFGPEGVW